MAPLHLNIAHQTIRHHLLMNSIIIFLFAELPCFFCGALGRPLLRSLVPLLPELAGRSAGLSRLFCRAQPPLCRASAAASSAGLSRLFSGLSRRGLSRASSAGASCALCRGPLSRALLPELLSRLCAGASAGRLCSAPFQAFSWC